MITNPCHICTCDEYWISICARTQGDERRFTKVGAGNGNGKVELEAWLDGTYVAEFDMSPDEAYDLAERLVAAAEVATVQHEDSEARRRTEMIRSCEKHPKRFREVKKKQHNGVE
jgi:hypothetical protein